MAAWHYRREGSSQISRDLTFEQIAAGLRDGKIEPTDEAIGPGETAWQAIENHPDFAEIAGNAGRRRRNHVHDRLE